MTRHILALSKANNHRDLALKIMRGLQPTIKTDYRFVLHLPFADTPEEADKRITRMEAEAALCGDHYAALPLPDGSYWGLFATNDAGSAKTITEGIEAKGTSV